MFRSIQFFFASNLLSAEQRFVFVLVLLIDCVSGCSLQLDRGERILLSVLRKVNKAHSKAMTKRRVCYDDTLRFVLLDPCLSLLFCRCRSTDGAA